MLLAPCLRGGFDLLHAVLDVLVNNSLVVVSSVSGARAWLSADGGYFRDAAGFLVTSIDGGSGGGGRRSDAVVGLYIGRVQSRPKPAEKVSHRGRFSFLCCKNWEFGWRVGVGPEMFCGTSVSKIVK